MKCCHFKMTRMGGGDTDAPPSRENYRIALRKKQTRSLFLKRSRQHETAFFFPTVFNTPTQVKGPFHHFGE